MHITRMVVERFGILHDQDVPDMSPGLTVFRGHNEAGKSTCLRFFQAMLFGYKRGNRTLDPLPERRGKTLGGGRLFLRTAALGDIVLARTPGAHGGPLSLTAEDGRVFGPDDFQRLVSGLTVEVFDTIFTITLRNLMELSTLKGDSVRHALHGAAFGLGLQSPAQVLKGLEDRMAALLKRDSASAAINDSLRELLEVQETIAARIPDMQQYRDIQQALDRVDGCLAALAAEREETDGAARRVQRRLSVWRQGEEVRRVQRELAALAEQSWCAPGNGEEALAGGMPAGPEAPEPVFAPDSLQRLETLQSRKEERLLAVQAEASALARLEAEAAALAPSPLLAGLYDEVQNLREQKDRRHSESRSLPQIQREMAGLAAAQRECLDRLGPGWTADILAGADTSLFAREAIHQSAAVLAEKEEDLRHAKREEARLAGERTGAQELLRQAEKALASHPVAPDLLPDVARLDALASLHAKGQNALGELPVLLRQTREAQVRTLRSLGEISPDWSRADLDAFDASLRARQHMLDAAAALTASRQRRDEALKNLDSARDLHAALAERLDAAEQRSSRHDALPDAPELEQRHARIRQLERTAVALSAARRECEAAGSEARSRAEALRVARESAGVGGLVAGPPFLALGCLLIAAGLCLVGMDAWEKNSVTAMGGLALALSGGMLCLLNFRAAQARRRAERAIAPPGQTLAEAEGRRDTLAEQVLALAEETAPWFAFENPDDPQEAETARALQLLERQGQQLALRERDEQDAAALQTEAFLAAQKSVGAEQLADAARTDCERAESAWKDLLLQARLPVQTAPESAGGLFDRVETARSRAVAAETAAQGAGRALHTLELCLSAARQEPFLAAQGSSEDWEKAFALLAESAKGGQAGNASPAMPGEGVAGGAQDTGGHPAGEAEETAATAALEAALHAMARGLAAARAAGEAALRRTVLASAAAERREAAERLVTRHAGAKEAVCRAEAALLEERNRWQAWLRERALPQALSPKTALEAVERILDFRNRQQALSRLREQADTLARGLEGFVAAVAATARKAGLSLPQKLECACPPQLTEEGSALPPDSGGETPSTRGSGTPAVQKGGSTPQDVPAPFPAEALPEALLLLDTLARQVEEAVRAGNMLAEKKDQRESRRLALAGARAALEATERDIAALLEGAGVPDAEVFRAAFARWERRERLQAEERALLSGIHALAGEEGSTAEDVLASLRHSTFDTLEGERERLAAAVAALAEEQRALAEERGQLRERQNALQGGQGSAPLRSREAVLKEELRRHARRWSVLALARDFLLTAKGRFEEEGQAGVIRFAGDIFAAITEGEYTGIAASLDGDAFTALHRSGDRRDPERQLSQGTREQMYLALRLAYVKNHASKAEPLPLIMDDILVNFDPGRARNTARVLAEFAKDNQALFFTCHPGTMEILMEEGQNVAAQKGGPSPALFAIDRGELRPVGV